MNSIEAQDIPDQLVQFFKARAESDPFYQDIVILVIDDGDVESDILQKLATLLGKDNKIGVALFILPINVANDTIENAATGPLLLDIGFQVWENRLINKSTKGTKKSGYSVARHTQALFKGFSVKGLIKLLVPSRPAIEKVPPPLGKKLKGWGINYTGREDDNFITPKVDLISFAPRSGVAATVVISCPTPGAAIWYTTDGTPPAPDYGTSTLYTVPINVPDAGFTIFASASLANYFDSNTISATFTKSP